MNSRIWAAAGAGLWFLLGCFCSLPFLSAAEIILPAAEPGSHLEVPGTWQIWTSPGTEVEWCLPQQVAVDEADQTPAQPSLDHWQNISFHWLIPWREPGSVTASLDWTVRGEAALLYRDNDGDTALWVSEFTELRWSDGEPIAAEQWHPVAYDREILWGDTVIWPDLRVVTAGSDCKPSDGADLISSFSPETIVPGQPFSWTLEFPPRGDATIAVVSWPRWVEFFALTEPHDQRMEVSRFSARIAVPPSGGRWVLEFDPLLRPSKSSVSFQVQWLGQERSFQPRVRRGPTETVDADGGLTRYDWLQPMTQRATRPHLHLQWSPYLGTHLHWERRFQPHGSVDWLRQDGTNAVQWQWKDWTVTGNSEQWHTQWMYQSPAVIGTHGPWYWLQFHQRGTLGWQESKHSWQMQWNQQSESIETFSLQYLDWQASWRGSDDALSLMYVGSRNGTWYAQYRGGWTFGRRGDRLDWQIRYHEHQGSVALALRHSDGSIHLSMRDFLNVWDVAVRWSHADWKGHWTHDGTDWLFGLSRIWQTRFGIWEAHTHWAHMANTVSSWGAAVYRWQKDPWFGGVTVEASYTPQGRYWDSSVSLGWKFDQGGALYGGYHSRDGLTLGLTLYEW